MDFTREMFERADLKQIVGFILYGSECYTDEKYTYTERLRQAEKEFFELIQEKFKDFDTQNEICIAFSKALCVWENVYCELGIKFAAKILSDL